MSTRSLTRFTLLALVLIAFLLRVFELGRNSLWYDELLQVRVAGGSFADFFPQLELNAAMPLDYLIERGWLLVVGSSEFIVRFSAAAFSTLSVVVLYRLGKLMFNRRAGLIAAAFLAVASFSVLYAHEARPYALYMLMVLGSFYWLYRALQTNRLAHWVYYGLFTAAAVLTHLFALFVIIAQVSFVMIGLVVRVIAPRRAQLFGRIKLWMIGGVAVAVVVFGIAVSFVPNLQYVPGSAMRFALFLLQPSLPPPDQWSGVAPGETPPLLTFDFFYSRILENFSGGGLPATLGFVLLGVCGLAALRRLASPTNKFWETCLLVLWSVLPAALIVLFLIHYATLFAARYLIAALPAWLLLCALGTLGLGELFSKIFASNARVRRTAIAVIALAWIVISLQRSAVVLAAPKEDWRAAGQFLDANLHIGDAVVTPGGSYLVYHYAPHASQQNVPAEVQPEIADVENHYPRVWLVLNRYVYDPGGTIQTWLQTRGAVEFQIDDTLQIYYWRANADNNALLADAVAMTLPPTADAYRSLADQFANAGDLNTAEKFYTDAILHATTSAEAAQVNTAWGDAERRAGNLEQAAQKYSAALGFDSQQVDAWVGLARVYLQQNQLQAAHDALNRALALDPNSYAALLFLANYYQQSGQTDAANAAYARAAQIVPELTLPP